MKLEGKTALIAGGTSGIGLATAQEFIREGAKVVVTGRTPDMLSQAAKVLGSDALVVSADVTKPAELDELFKLVREKHDTLMYSSPMLASRSWVRWRLQLKKWWTNCSIPIFEVITSPFRKRCRY